MLNASFKLVLLCLFLSLMSSYSLSGDWILKNMNGQASNISIDLNIQEKVINNQIQTILTFKNCDSIVYQVQISENYMSFNNVYYNNNSYIQNQTNIYKCSQQEMTLQKKVSQTLKEVFFFNIQYNLLVFISPNGSDLFEFQRVQKEEIINFQGNWILNYVYFLRPNYTIVNIQNGTAQFCQGKVNASYQTDNIYQIQFSVTKNDNCSEANVTKALSNIRYFRIEDTLMKLYDQSSQEIMQLFYQKGGANLTVTEKIVNNGTVPATNSTNGGMVSIIANLPADLNGSSIVSQNLRSSSP